MKTVLHKFPKSRKEIEESGSSWSLYIGNLPTEKTLSTIFEALITKQNPYLELMVGISITHEEDQFSKREGYRIAFNRAEPRLFKVYSLKSSHFLNRKELVLNDGNDGDYLALVILYHASGRPTIHDQNAAARLVNRIAKENQIFNGELYNDQKNE